MKKVKRRISRVYNCKYAPFVTNWSGVLLDKKSRDELQIDDVVRIMVETKDNSFARYVKIKCINNKYLTGIICDPYNGTHYFYCNNCYKYCESKVYACSNNISNDGHNDCDFHFCQECYNNKKNKHKHKMIEYRHAYSNGTIMTFKKTCIMEIPNWTNNTKKIIDKYINKDNIGRMFTGVF